MIKIENVGIIGIGSYVPEKILTNEDIDLTGIGTDSYWTKEKLGIEERRVVVDENPSDLAYHAAIDAIKDAGIDKEEIDLIIVAIIIVLPLNLIFGGNPGQKTQKVICSELNNSVASARISMPASGLYLPRNRTIFQLLYISRGVAYALSN